MDTPNFLALVVGFMVANFYYILSKNLMMIMVEVMVECYNQYHPPNIR